MRRQEKVMNEPTKGNGTVYRMFIDDKPYESSQRYLTGAQLREMAHIERQYRIFFEKHREENEKGGHPPEREIHNANSVDLAEPGEEKFYTLRRPLMDIS
jgi:hypothetical protein